MRRTALVALALLAPAPAAAAEAPRVREYVDLFTTKAPAASSGRHARVDLVNPDDPQGKPPALRHVLVEFHPGSRFDTNAIQRCGASDAELALSGPAACPPGSRVGGGRVDLDTGFPGPGRIVENDYFFFNAKDQLILLTRQRSSGSYIPLRGRVSGNRFEVDLSTPLPGTPPDGGVPTAEQLTFQENSTARGNYLTTPRTCPESGRWTNRVTYTFRDGVVQSFSSTSRCLRLGPDRERPKIRIRGVARRGCLSRSPLVRVSVADRSGVAVARLYVDRRRTHTTSAERFRKRLRLGSLDPGRHRLKVVARDAAGNWAARALRFRRC